MKSYLLTTAMLFGGITIAHVARVLGESPQLATDPFYAGATIVSAALCVWACRLLRLHGAAVATIATLMLQPSSATAQTPAAPRPASVSPATPSAPHERMAFFEGSWTIAELLPERAYRERCAWMEGGRRHMICRVRSRAANGETRESISMFSYRAADSSYLYYGLRPSGATEQLTGRATVEGWEFLGETGVGASRERKRVTIERLAGGRFRFLEAVARGDSMFSAPDSIHYVPAPAER